MVAKMVEELEKKMESKIEEVRDMMLDRFSGVDLKLTSIEGLLKKIMKAQDQLGDPMEKETGKGGVKSSKIQNKENKVVIGGCDDRPSREYGVGSPYGWIGLYTHQYGKDNPPGPDFGMGIDFCAPAWVGLQQESNFRQKNGPHEDTRTQRGRGTVGFEQNVVKADETGWGGNKGQKDGKMVFKMGQDDICKDSSKRVKMTSVKSDQWGTPEACMGSSGSWDKLVEKTNVSLQDSSKADQWGKKASRSWGKEVENESNGKCGSVESDEGRDKLEGPYWGIKVNEKTNSNDGWGKKRDHKPQAQGSWGWKKSNDWGPKRKRPNSPVWGPNDCTRSTGPFTATKQRLDFFTSDEQEILTEIEPIMESIRRILHQDGYNDGDPLSADDQSYILNNVFNYHPNKDQKMGAGVDCIMVDKHMKHQESRCLYVITADGRKEDFSYHKCLKNFVTLKYPDKVDKFMPKYLKMPRSRPTGNMDNGYGADEVVRPGFRSGWNPDSNVAADEVGATRV